MQEEFLHYLWKFRLFDTRDLKTTVEGEPIEILKCGEPNSDSGPDFFNAKIKIGKTIWAGNVEIHVRASDWEMHKHQQDKAYDNVILHVVYQADKELRRKNGERIPTLELNERIPNNIYQKYLSFKSSRDWIPCGKQIKDIDSFTLNHWLDRLLVERLERKSIPILESLKQNKNNREETFYRHLARNFGLKINAEPFELLAKSLPVSVLGKHKNSLLQIEALLFGVAGMLHPSLTLPKGEGTHDEYFLQLKKEYEFLKNKFKLKPIDSHLWKFMRLHPPNFPTVRISQFANLIYKSSHLFSKIIETKNIKAIRDLLSCETSEYWKTHYRFDKQTPLSFRRGVGGEVKRFGDDAISNIIINTIAPFVFIYGKEKGAENYVEHALELLEKTLPEKNAIISKWKELGINAKNAYETQALLQLKNEYCSKKRCLKCSVGARLLHPSPSLPKGERESA
ncbi:MAG: DUF2851 family protein [Bacteroidetes bacterium]|nr:DUF2851 family protein [Bacteroidota bacterium]